MATTIDIVDLAGNVKKFINHTTVKFDSVDLKNKIFNTADDDFLRIIKTIGSDTTIMKVDLVDDNFISRAVLGE